MSAPQSHQFDPNKDLPPISEATARQIEAEIAAGTAFGQLTPEQIALDEKAKREFIENELRIQAECDRVAIRDAAEKRRKEQEKLAAKRAGWEVVNENTARAREKQLLELNDCIADIFRSLAKLNVGLKKFSVEELESLPGLKPGLESLLKKL